MIFIHSAVKNQAPKKHMAAPWGGHVFFSFF